LQEAVIQDNVDDMVEEEEFPLQIGLTFVVSAITNSMK
jgi:hypothetical protein